ncbi:MAG: PepSY-associated TM helix domain-containing protein, partial [Stenotrophomonas sp.]
MKSVLRTLHRWCGLVTAVFLIISGVTGSLLAFEHELDAWLNPELFYTGSSQSVQPVQPALAANRLIEQIEANEPRIRVSQLPLDAEPGSAIEVQVEPRMAQSPTGFNRLWVDPATGRILGHRTWGVWQGDRAHFMPWLNRFHRSLTLPGRTGHQLLGAVAMAWLAMSLTG